MSGIVGYLLHGPFYRVGSFQCRIPREVGDRGGKIGALGRKDVCKPVFYSAVLGVTALVCYGTLLEGPLQDVNIASVIGSQ